MQCNVREQLGKFGADNVGTFDDVTVVCMRPHAAGIVCMKRG